MPSREPNQDLSPEKNQWLRAKTGRETINRYRSRAYAKPLITKSLFLLATLSIDDIISLLNEEMNMLSNDDFRVVAAAYKAGIITIDHFQALTNGELELDLTIMARAVHRVTGERLYAEMGGKL